MEITASTTVICASSLKNYQHHAVDQPMPSPAVVVTLPTRHLGSGTWVHAPSIFDSSCGFQAGRV